MKEQGRLSGEFQLERKTGNRQSVENEQQSLLSSSTLDLHVGAWRQGYKEPSPFALR